MEDEFEYSIPMDDIEMAARGCKALYLSLYIANEKSRVKSNKKSSNHFAKAMWCFAQQIMEVSCNGDFGEEVKAIRIELGIPPNGFGIYEEYREPFAYIKNNSNIAGGKVETGYHRRYKENPKLVKWLMVNKRDDFNKVLDSVNNHCNATSGIKTSPVPLLNFLYEHRDTYLKDRFYHGNAFMENCPDIEIYKNYLNEKPFSSVFDYILTGRVLIPFTNFINVITRDDGYLDLLISPNASVRDFGDALNWLEEKQKDAFRKNRSIPSNNKIINATIADGYVCLTITAGTTGNKIKKYWGKIIILQKALPNYEKNKTRFVKNRRATLEIKQIDEKIRKINKKLKDFKGILAGKSSSSHEEILIDDLEKKRADLIRLNLDDLFDLNSDSDDDYSKQNIQRLKHNRSKRKSRKKPLFKTKIINDDA